MSDYKPTDSELEILKLLWEKSPRTVREINNLLNQEKKVGYTTTLKIMQIMYQKGYLTRTKQGKVHYYTVSIEQQKTRQDLLDKLVKTAFDGSSFKLVMQALGSGTRSKNELDKIRQYLDQLEGENND